MTTLTTHVQTVASLIVIAFSLLLAGCAATGAGRAGSHADPTSVAREIADLHRFFQDWFRGEIPETDEAFARFDRALAPGFVIVSPDGAALDRATIIEAVRRGYGRDKSARVWVEGARVVHNVGDAVVATYVEWQSLAGADPRARISTAVFEPDRDAPGGLRWIHVHETWLPQPTP